MKAELDRLDIKMIVSGLKVLRENIQLYGDKDFPWHINEIDTLLRYMKCFNGNSKIDVKIFE